MIFSRREGQFTTFFLRDGSRDSLGPSHVSTNTRELFSSGALNFNSSLQSQKPNTYSWRSFSFHFALLGNRPGALSSSVLRLLSTFCFSLPGDEYLARMHGYLLCTHLRTIFPSHLSPSSSSTIWTCKTNLLPDFGWGTESKAGVKMQDSH